MHQNPKPWRFGDVNRYLRQEGDAACPDHLDKDNIGDRPDVNLTVARYPEMPRYITLTHGAPCSTLCPIPAKK